MCYVLVSIKEKSMARKTKKLEVWCHEKNRDDLLCEWDYDKNMSLGAHMHPSKIEYNRPYRVYWICQEGHRWECRIVARTLFDFKCPICNPKMDFLPKGTKNGCLTIIEKTKDEDMDSEYGKIYGPTYKCKCKCGNVIHLYEFHFLEKKHVYCTDEVDTAIECGLRKKRNEKLRVAYKRNKHDSYNIDYSNTIHESLEILECIDDQYEELTGYTDRRKRDGGHYTVYKLYKCRCYLCGKKYQFKSSDFEIKNDEYGYKAQDGYYCEAYCDCHSISSFQWRTIKILKEHNVSYRVEVSFSDLYGVKHKNLLRYDFIVFDSQNIIKCLIECQGEQHYKPVDEFGGVKQYEFQVQNDDLKRAYSKKHNIALIEIPYTCDTYDKEKNFLKEKQII